MRDTAVADGHEAHEIAERLAAGDPDVIAWLYDNTGPELYWRLQRRYGYPGGPDAADVLQETFLLCLRDGARLLRAFVAGQPPGAPALPALQRYLWDLACGVASNVRRSVWSRRALPLPDVMPASVFNSEPPAERSAVARQALQRLAGCIQGQGERLFLYFKLRHVDGLTPEEVSAATGWSRKATYKLRQALNEAVERCVDRLGLQPGAWLALAFVAVVLCAASACRRQPPLLRAATVVRGQREVVLARPDEPRPLVLGRTKPAGLCFAAPAAEDTSRWEAALFFDGQESPSGFRPAAARAGSTLCFDGKIPPRLSASQRLALCGRLVDRFDGSIRRLPCRDIAFQPDSRRSDQLETRVQALLAQQPVLALDDFLGRLDVLASAARASSLPLLDARLQLVAAHFLTEEGTPAALAAARRRLDRLPAWLGGEAALARSAQADFQRGRLALAHGARGAAWLAFQGAEDRAARIGDPMLLRFVLQEADLLSQAGAPGEALERVRSVLGQCGSLGCQPELVLYGRMQLAWLTLLDTDAAPRQLAEARGQLRSAIAALTAERRPYDAANQRVNLAYLELRLGGDPRPLLAEASQLAALPGTGSAERRMLEGWSSLLAGLAALERHGPAGAAGAVAGCGAISTADPQLAAARWSCLGRAERLAGDLPSSARAFEAALAQHERIAASLDQRLPLGPGERAEDYARAARVSVERGDADSAWRLLVRLDSLSAQERQRARCRELARGGDARRWDAIERESARVLRDLRSLPPPASGSKERETAALRTALEERLRLLWRQWPGCASPAPAGDRGVDFRAFAVEDEVLLLRRDAAGDVKVDRRSLWPRLERLAALRALAAEIESGGGDAERGGRWNALAMRAAAAVLPQHPEALAPVTTFALHGSLQLLPLAALPLGVPESAAPRDRRSLADATTVAVSTAGAQAMIGGSGGGGGSGARQPLFVVDPSGDLAGAERSLSSYRRLFPGGTILQRGEATRDAVGRALAGAEWLHVDAHASYDPVFPEMSRLQLADGELSLMEWSRLPAPRRFANLSGCRTASWPATADSGQYGLGGLLTRLGAGWVVATRGPIPDAAADRYNQAFYRAIAAGSPVPAAHASGLTALRAKAPPQVWGAILLLRAAGAAEGDNLARGSLPSIR